jgi:flagellar basal-body rod protein FlgC
MQTDGPVPATPPSQPVTQAQGNVYQATSVSDTTMPGGGVSATARPVLPSYLLAPGANGMMAMPNVDLATQMVDQIEAVASYRTNIAAFNASDDTVSSLLDTLA